MKNPHQETLEGHDSTSVQILNVEQFWDGLLGILHHPLFGVLALSYVKYFPPQPRTIRRQSARRFALSVQHRTPGYAVSGPKDTRFHCLLQTSQQRQCVCRGVCPCQTEGTVNWITASGLRGRISFPIGLQASGWSWKRRWI